MSNPNLTSLKLSLTNQFIQQANLNERQFFAYDFEVFFCCVFFFYFFNLKTDCLFMHFVCVCVCSLNEILFRLNRQTREQNTLNRNLQIKMI